MEGEFRQSLASPYLSGPNRKEFEPQQNTPSRLSCRRRARLQSISASPRERCIYGN